MSPNILVTKADFLFDGFLSNEFPLGTALDTMSILHQRVVTARYQGYSDARDRVYYNLVVLFRLLWHHRLLESTPLFWGSIWADFESKAGKAQQFRDITAHYVNAREAFHQRYGPKSGSNSTLARLVDQWSSRRPTVFDKDVARVRQAPGVYSRLMRESWNAVLDHSRSHERLVFGKDLNWPIFKLPPPDNTAPLSDISLGALASCLRSTTNSESKQGPDQARTSIQQDPKPVPQVCLPPTPHGKGDQAPPKQGNLLSSAKVNSEPGRLTPPPVEPQSHGEETTTLDTVETHLIEKKNGVDNLNGEGGASKTATPRKRPAPPSDELSPFSKRRQITQMAHNSPNGEQEGGSAIEEGGSVNGGTSRLAYGIGGIETIPGQPQQTRGGKGPPSQHSNGSANGGTSGQAHGSDGIDPTPALSQRAENGKGPSSQRSKEPKPSVALQSLEEMIASAGGSPSTGHGSSAMSQPSLDMNGGLLPPVREAPVAEAQNNHGTAPVVYYQVINVPATLFALSHRIENLERAAGGQPGAERTLAAVVRGMTELGQTVKKQADIAVAVPNLSGKVSDLEKIVKDREQLSKTVDETTSALACTIEGLEKKLKEAADTRVTIAALTRRITELEKTVREGGASFASRLNELEKTAEERSAAQDDKIMSLEGMIEGLGKILEAKGLSEAGEIVE